MTRTIALGLVLLTMTASACSVDQSEPTPRTCVTHYANGREPTLLDSHLMAGTRSLCFRAFAVLHSGITRTPLYAAEYLTRASVIAARRRDIRDNRFHAEPRLPSTARAELADYRRSGFDRGHMAPSGDMGSHDDDHDSFSLANVVPQDPTLNRHGWADLEQYVRSLTLTLGEAYVITGVTFAGRTVRRAGGRVLVPSHVWKAVYIPGQGAGAWIVGNRRRGRWEIVSIAQLARRTGIDPFPRLDARVRARIPAFPVFD